MVPDARLEEPLSVGSWVGRRLWGTTTVILGTLGTTLGADDVVVVVLLPIIAEIISNNKQILTKTKSVDTGFQEKRF